MMPSLDMACTGGAGRQVRQAGATHECQQSSRVTQRVQDGPATCTVAPCTSRGCLHIRHGTHAHLLEGGGAGEAQMPSGTRLRHVKAALQGKGGRWRHRCTVSRGWCRRSCIAAHKLLPDAHDSPTPNTARARADRQRAPVPREPGLCRRRAQADSLMPGGCSSHAPQGSQSSARIPSTCVPWAPPQPPAAASSARRRGAPGRRRTRQGCARCPCCRCCHVRWPAAAGGRHPAGPPPPGPAAHAAAAAGPGPAAGPPPQQQPARRGWRPRRRRWRCCRRCRCWCCWCRGTPPG